MKETLDDLLVLCGTAVDIVHCEGGFEHHHFREVVVALSGDRVVVSRDSAICARDFLFMNGKKYCVSRKVDLQSCCVLDLCRESQ